MAVRAAFNYLLIAPHILLLGVLFALWRRKNFRNFPIFSAYILMELVQFGVLFVFMKTGHLAAYSVGYSTGLAVSTALRFGVLYEISANLFRNYAMVGHFGKPLFRWTAVLLLLGALLLALYAGGVGPDRLLNTVRVLDRTASILQVGLLLSLFALSSYLRLSWRSYVFGIALAMGILACAELIASAIRAQTGFAYVVQVNFFTMAVYHCCVLVWIGYLLAPETSAQYAVKKLPDHDLEVWNTELQRFLHR